MRAMQISGQPAPDLYFTDASNIDWDTCWESDVGTPLIKKWSKLAGSSLKRRVITPLFIGLHGCSSVCLELAWPVRRP